MTNAATVDRSRPGRKGAPSGRREAGSLAGGGDVDALRIHVIGRVRAELDGLELQLGPAQQRAVLAWLALSANRPVQRTELIDLVWGYEPPPTVVNILQTYVKRLRRLLEPDRTTGTACELLPRVGEGYCLQVDPDVVDVLRARRIVGEAAIARKRGAHATVRALLAEASSIWTGPLFADLPKPAGHAKARAIVDEWQEAVSWDIDAAIELGQVAEVLPRIEEAAHAAPFEEATHARLMHAYRLTGRRADAIAVYHRIRRQLADELGCDPGQGLATAYQALLDATPRPPAASPVAPSQLPTRVGHFTGRAPELLELTRRLDVGADQDLQLLVLTGSGGIGKTTLALEAAHRVKDRFPDGQLFVDLRGDGAQDAVPFETVLVHLLRSLGAPPETITRNQADDLPWYRTLTSGRRLLLVLDNASDAAQVEPLIPAGSGSAVLVTSQHGLSSLATRYVVHSLRLDTLPTGEAVDLIGRFVGVERVAREADAARHLVELCGRFPLALRTAGAKLAARPLWSLSDFADDIAREDVRLAKLEMAGESSGVGAVFAGTYRSLSPLAARVFRAVGVCRLPSFAASLLSEVTQTPGTELDAALGDLHDSHLLVERQAGRYTTHDPIGLFATECARTDGSDADESVIGERMLRWYLAVAAAANRVLARFSLTVDATATTFAAIPPMATFTEALGVLDDERANLLPVMRYAVRRRPQDAWRLGCLLDSYFLCRGYGPESIEIGRLWLAAAERVDDDRAVVLARASLGRGQVVLARYDAALENLCAVHEHHKLSGDLLLQAIASRDLALAYMNTRRFDDAVEMYQLAADLFEAVGEQQMVAGMLNNLANAYTYLGRPVLAREHLTRASEIIETHPDDRYTAAMLSSTGSTYLAEGDPSHPEIPAVAAPAPQARQPEPGGGGAAADRRHVAAGR